MPAATAATSSRRRATLNATPEETPMTSTYDLVIRGGAVVDGTGAAPAFPAPARGHDGSA